MDQDKGRPNRPPFSRLVSNNIRLRRRNLNIPPPSARSKRVRAEWDRSRGVPIHPLKKTVRRAFSPSQVKTLVGHESHVPYRLLNPRHRRTCNARPGPPALPYHTRPFYPLVSPNSRTLTTLVLRSPRCCSCPRPRLIEATTLLCGSSPQPRISKPAEGISSLTSPTSQLIT